MIHLLEYLVPNAQSRALFPRVYHQVLWSCHGNQASLRDQPQNDELFLASLLQNLPNSA